jgi:hypothetical protein
MSVLGQILTTVDIATAADLTAHIDDATAAHAASAIAFTPAGSIAATTVQAAIEEVATEAGGATPTLAAVLEAGSDAGNFAITGLTNMTTSPGASVAWGSPDSPVTFYSNGAYMQLVGTGPSSGYIVLGRVPTSDPEVAGAVYSDGAPSAGVPKPLMISGGPA